jgi:SAM-dependent methyltransferase
MVLSQQGIPSPSPLDITEEVRDFYERMPYPPPLTSLDDHQKLYRDNPDRRRTLFHRIWPARHAGTSLKILIAGCGTSQAAMYALRDPDARITGIDISETSLRHTRDLQRKYNLDNLELHQLPIERAGELAHSFDLIVSTGVLHHLPDPDAGLRALRNVLSPRGAMQLMVYAPYGRAGIYMIQKYCRLLGIGPSESDLRSLHATLEALPADHPIAGLFRRSKDFRRHDAMADALLHPQDRAYSVPQLYDWIEQCGMSFGRWVEQAPYLAACGAMASSPHAARLASLGPRNQYAAVELLRGTMVSHSFIAFRDDFPEKNQPIDFADDQWRGYIPISLPWTVRVEKPAASGLVVALINRSHTFTDLVLKVDNFEDILFKAIDGKRTLAAILRYAKVDNAGERRALDFFTRLWQYDQVVFDLSTPL